MLKDRYATFLALVLLLLLAGTATLAQETETEATAAGVDSTEPLADPDELEPAVPSAVLTADVRRTYTGTDGVMDEIELGRTEVTGNQELPKVLYIVPWQKSDPGDLTGKPVNTLLDEVLAPIDRSEFIRQVDYYHDVHGTDPDDE